MVMFSHPLHSGRHLSGGQVIMRGNKGRKRIVVIGIDGLDADLLRVYGPSLPNLRLLMLESPYLELQSCFPPDPAPSWASIYTGQNPAQHGMLSLQSNRLARSCVGTGRGAAGAMRIFRHTLPNCTCPRGTPSGIRQARQGNEPVSRMFIAPLPTH